MLELFAGYGGLGLGLTVACGAEPVVYVERGAFAAATIVARMEEEALARAPVWDDVGTFNGRAWRDVVDCVVGGSPCQGNSVAGKRLGLADPRSGLWREMLRIVDETGTVFVWWENVGGAISSALDVVTADLEGLGYRVAACTLRASDVGATHDRQRLFVLAYSESNDRRRMDWRRGRAEPSPDGAAGLADAERAAERLESRRVGGPRGPSSAEPRRARQAVEDPDDHERAREQIQQPERTVAAGAGGGSLAHAHAHAHAHGRESERSGGVLDEIGTAQRNDVDRRGGQAEMADSGDARREGRERAEPPRENEGAPRPATERGGDVVDASGKRAKAEELGRQRARAELAGHVYPPPPNDADGWREWTGAQPSFRRGVDGPADGVEFTNDRLELLGNGVVPVQSATAFLICWQRLFGE